MEPRRLLRVLWVPITKFLLLFFLIQNNFINARFEYYQDLFFEGSMFIILHHIIYIYTYWFFTFWKFYSLYRLLSTAAGGGGGY